MHKMNKNKSPMIQPTKISRNLSKQSEALKDLQLDKRLKIGGGKMVGQAAGTRSRLPLAAVNALPRSSGVVPTSKSSYEDKSRHDVEKLLGEKLNPKNRNEEKGRNAVLRELVDGYLVELEKLHGMLDSEHRSHSDFEAHITCRIDVITLLVEEHQKHVAFLEESLRDQIKMIQEKNKRLQEYNTSLEQYNNNLQAELMMKDDTITKLRKDEAAMRESLAELRGQSSLVSQSSQKLLKCKSLR